MRILYYILIIPLFISCNGTSENKRLLEVITILSKKNDCNISIKRNSLEKNTAVKLETECEITNPYSFGKILSDFYHETKKFKFSEYSISNNSGEIIINLTEKELIRIEELHDVFTKHCEILSNQKFSMLCSSIHQEILKQSPCDTLLKFLPKQINKSKFRYNGFFLVEQNFGRSVVFSAENNISDLVLVYSLEEKSDYIMGLDIKRR